jgi:hypothetical protein
MKTAKRLSIPGMVMVAVFVLGLGIANANIIPFNTSVTGSGPYTWNYRFDLSADQIIKGGTALINPVPRADLQYKAFLTIYDFAGYVLGSVVSPAGWAATVQTVGFTPDDIVLTDNPSIVNITWAYSGSNVSGPLQITGFSAQSIYGLPGQIDYTSRGLKSDGTIGDNHGTTQGPKVPEPVTLILFGTGLLGLVGLRRKLS